MTPSLDSTASYQPLQKYLNGRFADTVVLRFSEIEDIVGFPLPDLARQQREWWADAKSAPSVQSRSWIEAHRTATPNLGAESVSFERSVD